MKATLADYRRLIDDRPEKFDEAESGYRDAGGEDLRCQNCMHLFERKIDKFKVCEVVRPTKGDEEIKLHWTCRFHTDDGEEFPLL